MDIVSIVNIKNKINNGRIMLLLFLIRDIILFSTAVTKHHSFDISEKEIQNSKCKRNYCASIMRVNFSPVSEHGKYI